MAVVVAKPDTHQRSYSFLKLDNGIKAIIGSDAACDKAGASLVVNVGMCHERKDLPGLAHFLEHMLFTGTTKYPKEGEYHEFMNQNGGMANAYTACYFTNYMFEVKPDKLQEALDRFARFFTEPLLTQSCTDREINAVDSEFQGGFTQPWWRYVGIMHQSANPDHPFHVAVGNVKVLRDEPKERGIDLYDEMKSLYEKNYSANGMTLCIIGKEPIAEMEAIVKEKFGGVVDKKVTMPIGDAVSPGIPAFLPKDWNRLLLQSPVKDIKELDFTWVIPFQKPLWKSKPTQYVSHLLGYEGSGSVIAKLKEEGLISGCYSGNGAWLEGAFSLCKVTFDLTDKGLSCIKEIGTHLFAFIGLLQKTAVQKWIYDELSNLVKIQFQFCEDRNPFDLAPSIAESLQHYDPSEALAGDMLLYEYGPEAISSIIASLTLDSVRVSHQAKCLEAKCTDKDTSYDSPMKFLPIEEEWLTAWGAAINPGDGSEDAAVKAAEALGLSLPNKNPFIPEDLALKTLPAENPKLPARLAGTAPVANIVHRQDDQFKQPKADVRFNIFSPYVMQDVGSYVKVELWSAAVQEALQEFAYDAEIAGVSYNLGIGSGYLTLAVSGFNDKLQTLLDAITDKMVSLTEIPENIYDIVYDSYADNIKNQAFHSQPFQQCGIAFSRLVTRGTSFPPIKKHDALQSIKRADLSNMATNLFTKCHVEAMVLGNTTADEAKQLSVALTKGLKLEQPLAVLPERAEAVLPAGSTVWTLDSTDAEDPNHAVFMRIQVPEGVENNMMMNLLNSVLSSKFFDVLRTQQQLGYIVQMAASGSSQFVYLIAVAQSEYPPDYVRSRIDAFLEDHFKYVEETLAEEEFETCQQGLLSDLTMKPKNLGEEAGHYHKQFAERTFDFGRRQRSIKFVEGATLEGLRKFARETVKVAPRIYNQVKKVLAKEDKALPEGAVVPDDPPDLRKWTTRDECIESFGASAEWRALNTTVNVA